MILNEPIRIFYAVVCFASIVISCFLTSLMFKKQNKYRYYITWTIFLGIISTICYCIFLFTGSQQHSMAVFFDSLFFIGTDWLAMCMYLFSISYTGVGKKHFKLHRSCFFVLCIIDSVMLIVNNFTHHMYDLIAVYNSTVKFFWANNFYGWHYVHLFFCYVMVFLTFVNFAVVIIKSPGIYKSKYLGIFVTYVVVIFSNALCYSANLPIDFSVVFYTILAGFISYYSTFSFPHQLLSQILKMVNETISDGILYFDYKGDCIYANKTAKEIFSEEGKYKVELAQNYQKSRDEKYIHDAGFSTEQTESFVVNGQEQFYKVDYHREYQEEQMVGSSLKLIDISTIVRNIQQEEYIISHDELTGIYNRTGFMQKVDEYVEKNGSANYFMITSDIKDFKLINEFFGQKVGDEILLKEAYFLKKHSHEDTLFGRIGDDNFGLFVKKDYFNVDRFELFVESITRIIEGSVFKMHMHIGIYDPQERNESAQIMVDKANMAISQIVNNYNQIFAYYDSTFMEQLLNEKNIIDDFEQAISSGQIKMYLQPIIDSKNAKLGAEALCRWEHPLRGFLVPSDFLYILEKAGLIYQLDEYIWELAAKKLHEWSLKGFEDSYIAVNISVKDVFFTDIYKTFTKLVEKYDINPACLHLEITETVLMSDFTKAYNLLKKLRQFGFVVAIDNFGSGFSSLNMLKNFNLQILKIDMSLLQDLENQEKNKIILETIIEMLNSLNIQVVGQGVETKEQYDFLRKYNCTIFQGNSLAPPVSVEEYEDKFIKYFFKS